MWKSCGENQIFFFLLIEMWLIWIILHLQDSLATSPPPPKKKRRGKKNDRGKIKITKNVHCTGIFSRQRCCKFCWNDNLEQRVRTLRNPVGKVAAEVTSTNANLKKQVRGRGLENYISCCVEHFGKGKANQYGKGAISKMPFHPLISGEQPWSVSSYQQGRIPTISQDYSSSLTQKTNKTF